MLEAGAEVKAARIPETNDRVAANRVLLAGFAMRYRAGRRHLVPEISAESLAYSARRECLLLSDAGTGDDRANFSDPGVGGGVEENVRRKETCNPGSRGSASHLFLSASHHARERVYRTVSVSGAKPRRTVFSVTTRGNMQLRR